MSRADLWVDDARRDLDHSHGHQAHEADRRGIALDEEDGPRGEVREITLRQLHAVGVPALRFRLGVIGPLTHERLADRARDRAVPFEPILQGLLVRKPAAHAMPAMMLHRTPSTNLHVSQPVGR